MSSSSKDEMDSLHILAAASSTALPSTISSSYHLTPNEPVPATPYPQPSTSATAATEATTAPSSGTISRKRARTATANTATDDDGDDDAGYASTSSGKKNTKGKGRKSENGKTLSCQECRRLKLKSALALPSSTSPRSSR